MAAEAVAAMDRAGAGGDQQGPARILLQQSRHQDRGGIVDRIGCVTRRYSLFGHDRENLPQQGVGGVCRSNAGQISSRHKQRKTGGRADSLLGEFGGQA